MGTSSSPGSPLIASENEWMDMNDKRNWRTRPAIHVVMDGFHIQVDTGPEFRLQCLWNQIEAIDMVMITHEHTDHVAGLDDLRRFCTLRDSTAMPLYSTQKGIERIKLLFPYGVVDTPERFGYMAVNPRLMPEQLEVDGGYITSAVLPHGKTEVLGLVFQEKSTGRKVAYYTDCNAVPEGARDLARGADILILDALRYKPHASHLTVDQAIEVAQDIQAKQTYFTHFAAPIDHGTLEAELPEGIKPAYDGLRISL